MLHSKKSQSILQWFNSLTTKGDANSIEQFKDGSHFYEVVIFIQSFLSQGRKESDLSRESVIFSETSIACNEEVITSVEKEAAEGIKETSVSESGNADPFVIKESDEIDTQKKYDVVGKFIDEFYHVDSFLLIDYGECQKGKELELAKVAVFLLSALAQTLLSSGDKLVHNITFLEQEDQVNIRECMELVLVTKYGEENPIKKSDLHKILSRGANYKGTQPRKSRSCPQEPNDSLEGTKLEAKKRKDRSTVIVYEDSPLKSLLQSPKIRYKADLMKKDSELSKLKEALYNEENKVNDLTLDKQNMNDELAKKKKDLEFYKRELESLREVLNEKEEQEKLRTEELNKKKIEEERIRKRLQSQEEEIKELQKENEDLQVKALDLEKKLEPKAATSLVKENESLRDKIYKLDVSIEKKDESIKVLNEEIRSLKNELKSLQDEIQELPNTRIIKEFKSQNAETLSTIFYAASDPTSDDPKTVPVYFQFTKNMIQNIIRQLERRKLIPPVMIKSLKENCKNVINLHGVAASLRDISKVLDIPVQPSVTTRSRVAAEELDANSLTGKNKDFEKENETLKNSLKLHQNKLKKKVEELSKAKEDLERSNEKLTEENENLQQKIENMQQEVIDAKEKYISMSKLAKKKDLDVKKALVMYHKIVKLDNNDQEAKKECSEECEKLRKSYKKLREDCLDFQQETNELKRSIRHKEGMMEQFQFEIQGLKTKIKELELKLWEEKSAFSKNTTDRDALVFHYLKKSKHEPKKIKDLDYKKEEQKKFSRPIVKVDAYILNSDNEPSMSNSMLASRSIRNSYFQVADEDDFLNESSLAEIHNMGVPGGESGDHRLLEIQRRNTLCPPHLQSSYPLEIQNMTPSERKYYNPGEVSYDLGRKSSIYGKRDIHQKLKSKYMESDSDDSDDSHSFPVKRLKVAETVHTSVPVSKKTLQTSHGVVKRTSKDQGNQRKSSTPLKQVAAYVKKRSTFKTPLAVHRLMSSSKNKIH